MAKTKTDATSPAKTTATAVALPDHDPGRRLTPSLSPAPGGSEEVRTPRSSLPELLAPAGDWECARAAVENGADAIYFGLERFNARMRAHNFSEADLPKLMEFLHRRGVKGYVTFNTLVFQNELPDAEHYLRSIIAAGVDAAIVQDVGMCRLIRSLSPDFPIHGSTQMTVTSAAGVEFARELGCHLVVLARENSLKEIGKIQDEQRGNSAAGDHAPLPLEVFVHGALCVAYSGQCLTSEALGGRSANRGECAQACRMPYELIADGALVSLGDRKYLLSPQDLAGLEVLPDLVRAGVASLKIEGRLKTPEYVANITRVYRQALDNLVEGPTTVEGRGSRVESQTDKMVEGRESRVESQAAAEGSGSRLSTLDPRLSLGSRPSTLDPRLSLGSRLSTLGPRLSLDPRHSRYDLEMAFSRGLYTGWFAGVNNQALVHARFGKKRGVFLGEVARVEGDKVMLQLIAPLKPGDGVVFDAGHPDQQEQGGRVYEVTAPRGKSDGETMLAFGRGDIDFARIHSGDKVWKTSDPELDRRLRRSYEGESPKFQRPLDLEVHGRPGQAMTLIARDESGHVARVESAVPLTKAEKQPLTTERLREQLGRLGGTPFRIGQLNNHLEGEVIVPVSELNRMRRQVVQELETLRAKPRRWAMNEFRVPGSEFQVGKDEFRVPGSEFRVGEDEFRVTGSEFRVGAEANVGTETRNSEPETRDPKPGTRNPELIVLVRDLPQLEAALRCGVDTLYCEFEDPKKYREAVRQARDSFGDAGPRKTIWVAPPRISKPGEEWILKLVRSCDADGYLVRNYDHLKFFEDCRRVGDFSLNVANALTADYFKNRFGLERITASYDLNAAQLEALLQAAPPEWFEVTIHQHMPMFHMEHCVFCAFLSKGTDYSNCGRPCDRHEVKLRDRVGAEHVLKADAGCRNTVFNSRAQTGAEHVGRMLALGLRHFRVEFVNETPGEVAGTLARYGLLLRGEITGAQLWRELKLHSQLGVTRGAMERA